MAIAEQEAQLGLQDSTQPGHSNGRAGDRSSTGSTSSVPGSSGGGQRDGGAGGNGHRQALAQSTHSSMTFGGQRRYSGGTIGIASMLGSLSTVPTGRSISDGSMDRRVSSVLGTSETTPAEFAGLGRNGAAWRRQSAMGPRGTGGGGGGLGYLRWGPVRASGSRGAGWGEEIVDEEGDIEGSVAPGAGAGAGAEWSIDVGAERREVSKDEVHDAPKSEVTAEASPAKASPAKASPDGRSAVQDSTDEASLAEAPPVMLPEALPE